MKTTKKGKINHRFEIEEKEEKNYGKELLKTSAWIDPLLYNVGIYLMTPLLLGAFIGYGLDRFFKTSPIFVIVFLILGTISSFYNFWKVTKK